MKLKAVFLAIFVAGFAASFAVAKPPPGRSGDGTTSGTTAQKGKKAKDCKPRVTMDLRGTLVATAADSLTMDVSASNKHGRALAGTQLTLTVDASTKIRRHGHALLADLKPGDRLNVKVQGCLTVAAGGTATALLVARKIDAKPAKSDGTTTGTTTDTTVTTTTGTTTTTP
jgi:hypothetical protein